MNLRIGISWILGIPHISPCKSLVFSIGRLRYCRTVVNINLDNDIAQQYSMQVPEISLSSSLASSKTGNPLAKESFATQALPLLRSPDSS